jgi:succinyl-CoA synthetase alpha subunit
VKKAIVEKDSYYDSVFLMLINRDVKAVDGVNDAVVSMGTEMNVDLVKDMGLSNPEIEAATPNDLIIAVDGENEDAVDSAIETAKKMLNEKKSSEDEGEAYKPGSLDAAVREVPDANMVIISLPGEFAAREVRKALHRDLHVMLFSDNVPLEDEVELKQMAREKGLLMMGPDCGTAVINGKPLAFSNVVREGDIGIVAASGTGLQEVMCTIEKFGAGITQGIGTGGRDLKDPRVGGTMMLMGIEALKNDPATKVITVVSKPPAKEVSADVISALKATGKPVVVIFLGLEKKPAEGNIHYAGNLEEAAGMAVALSKGETYQEHTFTIDEKEVERIVAEETKGMAAQQKYIRGLFTGGTLADEAMLLLHGSVGDVYSLGQKDKKLVPDDPHTSVQHSIIDLGEDVFTVGRPHPMIDPTTREERIRKEGDDPEMAVMLLDVVLGYGSHEDPAGAITDAILEAKEKIAKSGGYLSVIASITGTEGDYQNIAGQKRTLESAGVVVMPSNYQASMLAEKIVRKVNA